MGPSGALDVLQTLKENRLVARSSVDMTTTKPTSMVSNDCFTWIEREPQIKETMILIPTSMFFQHVHPVVRSPRP